MSSDTLWSGRATPYLLKFRLDWREPDDRIIDRRSPGADLEAGLLLTESEDEFVSLQTMLAQEIDPHGIIEEMHVAETAKIVWEMLRIHRCKAAMINTAFREALK